MNVKTGFAALIAIALLFTACSGEGHGEQSREGQGEHSGSSQHAESLESGHGQEGEQGQEESATQYAKSDTYDHTRNGARLILNYDTEANEFVGTVENTTDDVLTRVRVEVHLSNGTELGPTKPTDLDPDEIIDVTLPATEAAFETWSAHPEVGNEEANHQSDRE